MCSVPLEGGFQSLKKNNPNDVIRGEVVSNGRRY